MCAHHVFFSWSGVDAAFVLVVSAVSRSVITANQQSTRLCHPASVSPVRNFLAYPRRSLVKALTDTTDGTVQSGAIFLSDRLRSTFSSVEGCLFSIPWSAQQMCSVWRIGIRLKRASVKFTFFIHRNKRVRVSLTFQEHTEECRVGRYIPFIFPPRGIGCVYTGSAKGAQKQQSQILCLIF